MRLKSLLYGFVAIILITLSYFILQSWGEPVSYNRDIRPIINGKCITCHGGVKKSAGVSFLFREEALDTADSGIPAIVPGDAEASGVYQRIVHHDPEYRMPLEKEPLGEQEIKLIKQWIDEGAAWEDHWAYVPPNPDISPPTIEPTQVIRNNIDHFIYAKLQESELTPAPEAKKEVLLRRLYIDLIGLPPTPEEARSFLNDPNEDAYEKLVDRLLASPHFGERWASMWLDLARYADTKGYEKDLERSIWKYRDWVIDAFNQDMPFDQFTVEQLAGDLLPDPTQDQLIATAFHRNTIANDEGGTDDEEFRVAAVIERVGTTFEVWQSTTMACVQCHSHPYDPIQHEEFYRFMAFFNNTEDRDIYNEQPNLHTYETNADEVQEILTWIEDHLKPEDAQLLSAGRSLHQQKEEVLNKLGYRKVEAEQFQATSKLIELLSPDQDVVWQVQDSSWIMFENVDLSDVEKISFRCATAISGGFIEVRLDSVNGKKVGQTEVTTTGKWGGWSGNKPDTSKWKEFFAPIAKVSGEHDIYYFFRKNRDLQQHLFHLDCIYYHEQNPLKQKYDKTFNQKLARLAAVRPVATPIMQDLPPEKSRSTHVFERGNWVTPGKQVEADVPEILGGIPDGLPNNRLGMAHWLVSEDNPVTARVAVNRFWKELFGIGIIETMEEFGSQGSPPSHVGLLDWLAVQFMDEHQWSMKSLLKQIVMSATYRQSSEATPVKIEKDPRNRMLSRGPRVRLSAEQVRDQILTVSGLLNREMYGPSVKPPRPDAISSPWSSWVADTTSQQYRRSLYIFGKRSSPHPMITTFDGTGRNVCVSRRIRTNTPLQALTLLNDSTFYLAAQQLAEVMAGATDVSSGLQKGYEKVMLRSPDTEKLAILRTLYQDAFDHYQQQALIKKVATTEHDPIHLKALALVANTMLNMDEFVTKN